MGGLLGALKMLKLWQVGMLAAVLVGAVGATYGVYALASSSGQQKLGQDQQVIPVQYGNVVNQVSTSGSLVFPDRQALTFGTQGTVEEVLVKEGQEVTEGQPLAKLDAATVSSLEKAVAQARASLRSAEAALAKANDPYTALDLVQAEAKVADARLSLQSAQDALDKVLQPTPEDVAKARAAVSSAKQSAKNAAEVLDSLKAGPSEADIAKAQSQVDAAKVSLANAESEFKLTDKDWAAKLKTAQGALNTTMDSYSGVFRKWLGIELAESERGLGPDTLLASWGADLTVLFDPGLRFQDIEQSFIAQGPAPDDPATPWNEVTVYTWMNIYPGPLVPTCEDGTLPTRGLCIKEEMDNAWNAYEKAVEGLEVAQIQAAKAIASTDTVLTRAKDSLAAAQEALANLKAGPDPLDIEARENQAVLALATLQRAEADLAKLLGAPDPLEVEVKQKRVALAQASLAKAEEDLAGLQAGADPLEIAIKEVDVALAQLALTTALQRLEGATLKAPLAGTVSLVNVEAGQTVNASTAIVEIVDLTVVELNGVVDEIDVLFVQVGAQANVTMDALPGQVLQGTVSSIASAAQSQQGVVSYPIRIRLQLPEGVQLRQGLSATARVVIREERDVLMVPIQSLYGTFEQPVVRVMNNGRIEERPVVLGNSDDYWVAVRQGLDEGEQVVMDAQAATTSQLGILGGTMRQQMGSQFQGQFPGSLPSGGFQRQR